MSSTRAFVSFAVCSGFALASASGLAAHVVVVGTGDPKLDVPAVQAAVDQGGHVVLRGHFSFDAPPTIVPEIPGLPLATVRVSREVTISGADDDGDGMATIERGQVPFEVEAHGASVTIRRLHFLDPKIGAIHVSAVSGLTVASCRIEGVEPGSPIGNTAIGINTSSNVPTPAAPGAPERISGRLSIVDNDIELGPASSADNNLGIVLFGAGVPGAEIDAQIRGNRISNVTEPGINLRYVVGHVDIERNRVSTAEVTGPSAGAFVEAIRVVNTGSYRIAHNFVECRWSLGFGIGVFSQVGVWPEEQAVVTANHIVMSPPEGAVLGQNSAGINIRGFARGNLVFANTISGYARNALSILRFPLPPAQTGVPANNAFVLNRLEGFSAAGADILVGDQVLNTIVIGEGSVEDHGVGTVIVPLP